MPAFKKGWAILFYFVLLNTLCGKPSLHGKESISVASSIVKEQSHVTPFSRLYVIANIVEALQNPLHNHIASSNIAWLLHPKPRFWKSKHAVHGLGMSKKQCKFAKFDRRIVSHRNFAVAVAYNCENRLNPKATTFSALQRSLASTLPLLTVCGATAPMVPWKPPGFEESVWIDLSSRLLRDRIIFLSQYLDESAANQLIATLLYLRSEDSRRSISIYFNSPGALMKPAMAVFDTMAAIECPLITINLALASGLLALLCSKGTHRYALPNSQFLMQKVGSEENIYGTASDIALETQESIKCNAKLIKAFARSTQKPLDKIQKDLKRDFYLSATEAVSYGLIDKVLFPKLKVRTSITSNLHTPQTFGRFEGSEVQRYQQYTADAGWGGTAPHLR